jgi:ATP-binding cassette, subfamily F, member 3
MILVTASHIHKAYGTDVILEDATLTVQERERVALVGPNGAGKSTLLKVIAGELSHDKGEVHIAKGSTIGYLAQHSTVDSSMTVYEELRSVYNDLFAVEKRMREVEAEMSEPSVYENESKFQSLSGEYARLQQQFTDRNGYAIDANVRSILHGLDFPEDMHAQSVHSLSGGQKTRLALGKQLLLQPNLLILDEPTNYLDIARLTWLEEYLKSYPGAVLIVSHDRYFLDALADIVYEIERGVTKRYKGNYSAYLEQKAHDLALQAKRFEQQQAEIARTEEYIRRNIEGVRTKQAQSRRKMLEKMDRIDSPITSTGKVSFSFDITRQTGNDVLMVEDVAIGYENKQLSKDINLQLKRGERVALIGPNGIGKSTLLKNIVGDMKPFKGSVRFGTNIDLGYYTQEQEDLQANKTVVQEVWDSFPHLDRREIRTILSHFLFTGDDLEKPISILSGGERARVALVKLMLQKSNVMILDEPTNHLDLMSKEVLEGALADYPGTLFFISHDRFFLNRLATRVVELGEEGLTSYLGNYDDYVEKKLYLEELAKENGEVIVETKEEDTSFEDQKRKRQEDRMLKREARKKEERLKAIEEEIAVLEEKVMSFEEKLCDPEIFNDPMQAKTINDECEAIKEQIQALYDEWEELSM